MKESSIWRIVYGALLPLGMIFVLFEHDNPGNLWISILFKIPLMIWGMWTYTLLTKRKDP